MILLLITGGYTVKAQSVSGSCSSAAAQQVTVGTTTGSLNYNDGTVNDPTVSGSCGAAAQDGWLWFTALSSSTEIHFTNGSNRDAALYVYSGACGTLTQVACANNTGSSGDETIVVATISGTSYKIRVVRVSGTSGNLSGTVGVFNVAPDACANAFSLTQTNSYSVTTYAVGNATQSLAPLTCSGFTSSSALDVWFSFVAKATTASVRIVPSGSFDAVIDVRSGSCNGSNIGCADANIAGGTETAVPAGLTVGQTYLVRVYDFNSSGNALPGTPNFDAGVFGNCSNSTAYSVTGGGSYCSGGSGVAVGLSNSQLGFSYQLKVGGVSTGSPVAGTGSAISFGNQTVAGSYTVSAINTVDATCTSTMTGSVTVTINTAPAISGQPSNVTVCDGGNASFSVTSSGTGLTYQWRKGVANLSNGGKFSGATSATLTIIGVVAGDAAADYNCVVNGICTPSVTSNNASLTVDALPSISGPSNMTVCAGGNASFSVTVSGTGLTYQWRKGTINIFNGGTVSGATSATLSITGVISGDAAANYNCVVSGTCTSTSNNASLTVNTLPSISGQPSNVIVCEGGNASFSVTASGTGISYQWRKGTVNITNGGTVSGATSAILTITGVAVGDAASDYNCLVSGTCTPSVSSNNATLVVNTASAISSNGNLSVNTSGSCTVVISNADLLAQISSLGSPAPSVTFTPPAGNFSVGTTTVTATAVNNCETAQATFNVIVTDNENPSFSGCPSNININNEAGVCGAHVSWTAPVASDNCSALVSNNYYPGDLFPVGTTAVNYSAVDPSNNSRSCSFIITVADNEAPVTVCQSINLTLDNTGNASITAAQLNNGSSDNCAVDHFTISQNSFNCSNLGANAITLTAYDATGNFSACSATVTVSPFATAIISGSNTICSGNNSTVHVVFTGTAPFNYIISDGSQTISGSTSNNPEDITIPAPSIGSHTFTFTSFNDAVCSGSVSGSASVVVNPIPDQFMITSISGASEACNGTIVQLTANISNAYSFDYIWNTGINLSVVKFSDNVNGPFVSGPFTTTGNIVYAEFGSLIGASGYNVGVEISNSCATSAYFYKWVRGIMGTPGNISGSSVACSNQTGVNYSVVNMLSTAVYNWTFSVAGATFSGQGTNNVSVNFPAFTSGQLCVTAALSCGGSSTSAPRCLAISNATALPSAINGPSKVCPGSTNVAYSVNPVSGAVGYNWTTPSGTSIVETPPYSNSIHVNFPSAYSGAPQIYVYGVSACGVQSAGRNKSVGSNIPPTPGNISGPSGSVCNSTVQYSINNVAGATGYNWTIPAGATNFIGQGSTSIQFTVPNGFTTGTVAVTAITNSCTPGNSGIRSLSITGAPSTPGNITVNPSAWCVGQTVNASVATVSPVPAYNWTITYGSIDAGQGSNNVDVITNASHVILQVRAYNSCGASGNRTLHINSAGCREENQSTVSSGGNQLAVAPNPAHNMITVSIDAKHSSGVVLTMTDISGRVVLNNNLSATAGVNKYEVDLSHLSKGIYLMIANFSGDIQKIKVVVE
ncbi:MAG: HYR domain-containing protein [Bacteroidia bacterium]